MVIFGTRAAHVKTTHCSDLTCPNCNNKESINISVYRRHVHLFWIPLFPVGKTGRSNCTHCKNVLEKKEMPNDFVLEYEKIKREKSGPIWQFAGLILFPVLILFISISAINEEKMEPEYIANPKVEDVYRYEVEDGTYSTLKVVKVSNDSVFVSPNDYVTERRSKVYKLDKNKNYSNTNYGVSKEELKEMYDTQVIYDVNR